MSKLVLVILFFVVAVVAINLMVGDRTRAFLKTAQVAQGRIVGKEVRTVEKNRRKEHWLKYVYRVGEQEHAGQEIVEHDDLWDGLREGADIEVLYDPDQPGKSHPAVLVRRRLGMAEAITGK